MASNNALSESKRKEDVEQLYKPDNYIDKFEMTSLERLPVTVIFHLVEVKNHLYTPKAHHC